MERCPWCGDDPLYQKYHDEEWGVPCFDERTLFEFLILEGAQAGLSWITVLKKREHYRAVMDGFDAQRIARYDDTKIAALLQDPGIIRNRLKVNAAVTNAQATLTMLEQGQGLVPYFWDAVGGQPIVNHYTSLQQVPASTDISERISKDLKRRGFRFVGPTIIYAFMQAVGLVNDHLVSCFRHQAVQQIKI